jgi:hypothetical protein
MITSAANLPREPKTYGSFRILDAASRLITVLKDNDIQSVRLNTIGAEIEEKKYVVMTDEEKFNQILQDLVLDLVPLIAMSPLEGGSNDKV